jgi:hypothetical protein
MRLVDHILVLGYFILYTSDPGDLTALCSEPERSKDERVVIVRV